VRLAIAYSQRSIAIPLPDHLNRWPFLKISGLNTGFFRSAVPMLRGIEAPQAKEWLQMNLRKLHALLLLLPVFFVAPRAALAQWTPFSPGPGARVIYVSNSGSNANDGLSEAAPKATLAAGYGLLRAGFGDHLLLRSGDTFTLSGTLMWTKSGASAAAPLVLGAYGPGPRPILDPIGGEALHITPGYRSGNTVAHIAIVGIHVRSAHRDFTQPNFSIATVSAGAGAIRVVGVETTAPVIVEDILIEGCRFEFLGQPIVLEGPYADSVRNVRVRRNVIADTYAPYSHTNGMYVANVRGLLVEENLVDGVQRAPGLEPARVTSSLSHAIYVQSTAREITMRRNIFARAFDGGMMRPGGLYEDNLVADVQIGTHQGFMFSPSAPINTGGVEAIVRGNAFLQMGSAQGIQAGNLRSGSFQHNLMLSGPTTGGVGFTLIGSPMLDQAGVNNLTVADNFVLGLRGLVAYGTAFSAITLTGNQFRAANSLIVDHLDREAGDFVFNGNSYYSTAPANQWFRTSPGGNRTLAGWIALNNETGAQQAAPLDPVTAPGIGSYHASIGGEASLASFLGEARRQSRNNWREQYTAPAVIGYLRSALNLAALWNRAPVALCQAVTVAVNPAAVNAGSFDPDGNGVAASLAPAGVVGVHPVTLTVVDPLGAAASCTTTLTLVIATPGGA
jgi:hypothetical protein